MDDAQLQTRFKPVLIYWRDAHADASSWTSIEDMDDQPYVVETVGFLLDTVKPDHVSIAQSAGADDGVIDHVLHIPSAMVVTIVNLTADKA